jgi:uncharacterized protein YdaU (DUF1376 family)
MSKLFSMPFIVDAYLNDTDHLSLEEHGAYCLLLFHMWKNKGSLPDDDVVIARKLRASPEQWLQLKPQLLPFLTVYGGQITQKRLQEEWNWAVENSARAKAKGKIGAKVRWERQRLLSSGHSRSYSPTNGREIALKEDKYITPLPPSETSPNDPGPIPEGLNRLLKTKLMQRTA